MNNQCNVNKHITWQWAGVAYLELLTLDARVVNLRASSSWQYVRVSLD